VIDGLTKNLFAAFDYRLSPFLFISIWLMVLFWDSSFLLVVMVFGLVTQAQPAAFFACLALFILLWLFLYGKMRILFFLAFLYPSTILKNAGIDFRSFVYNLGGRLKWRCRIIARTNWNWL